MGKTERRVQDWTSLIIGFGIAVYPWVVGYSQDVMATQIRLISGILIFLVAAAALIRFAEWEEWLNMLLGLAVAATPFIFKLTGNDMATQTLFIGGIIVAAMSAWELWMIHHPEGIKPLPH